MMKMKLFFQLLVLLLLTSCSSSKLLLQTGAQASKDGILVCQKGVDTYTLLSQQQAIDQSQQQIILILSVPNPAAINLAENKASPIAKEIAPRINAYKSLLSVYQVFGLLTGSDEPGDTKAAEDALTASYNNIKQLPDLSASVSGFISTAGSAIMKQIQSGSVKKHNEALYELTKAYLALWNDEMPVWQKYLGLVYNRYANQLRTNPAAVYDMAKVKEALTEPYTGDAVILELFRVKQINDVTQQKAAVEKQLTDFGKALTLLNQAHLDLSKDASVTSDASNTLNTLETLLQTK